MRPLTAIADVTDVIRRSALLILGARWRALGVDAFCQVTLSARWILLLGSIRKNSTLPGQPLINVLRKGTRCCISYRRRRCVQFC